MARARRVQIDQEMSFREAALALGRKRDPHGRKLRNMVLAREAQLGKWIALRLSGASEPKLRVTLAALYRSFPELRTDGPTALAQEVRTAMEGLREELRELVHDVLDRDLCAEVRRAVAAELARRAK